MKLLILGGTSFVGRHMAELALARGHAVTLFNRGRTHAQILPEAERLVGDRDGGLGVLQGRDWDAVLDVSGYFPRLVGASAAALQGHVGRYVYVSTVSVYADFSPLGLTEDAPLATTPDPTVETITKDTYGPLKALCEHEVTGRYGAGSLIVRPGIVAGPHDPTDRFTYWAVAMASGEAQPAPGPQDAPVQTIDARDLADFTVRMTEAGEAGTYNVVGESVPRVAFFEALRPDGVDTPLRWFSEAELEARDVAPSRFPFWTPEGSRGVLAISADRALAKGLNRRSLAQTAADTRTWWAAEGRSLQTGPSPEELARLRNA